MFTVFENTINNQEYLNHVLEMDEIKYVRKFWS